MRELLLLLLNRDRVVEQVHVPLLETEQLTDSQSDEARDQHENPVVVVDAFGDGGRKGGAQEPITLRRGISRRAGIPS